MKSINKLYIVQYNQVVSEIILKGGMVPTHYSTQIYNEEG